MRGPRTHARKQASVIVNLCGMLALPPPIFFHLSLLFCVGSLILSIPRRWPLCAGHAVSPWSSVRALPRSWAALCPFFVFFHRWKILQARHFTRFSSWGRLDGVFGALPRCCVSRARLRSWNVSYGVFGWRPHWYRLQGGQDVIFSYKLPEGC